MEKHPRIIRKEKAEFFRNDFTDKVIVAVFDGVANIVHVNELVFDDPTMFRRAMFMDDPFMTLPDGYLTK